jgi:hypothetical protein
MKEAKDDIADLLFEMIATNRKVNFIISILFIFFFNVSLKQSEPILLTTLKSLITVNRLGQEVASEAQLVDLHVKIMK